MTTKTRPTTTKLTARMEPFDSFWEAPDDLEKGYQTLFQFYKHNYVKHLPQNKNARILVVSCGPGYFVNMLRQQGYSDILGIDSDPEKVKHAQARGLNCIAEAAFPFLEQNPEAFEAIFCECEINHLTKEEVLEFLKLCRESLREGGTIIFHSINGANPITGVELWALNFDHYHSMTEYSLRQVLGYSQFREIKVIPLRLYVFYRNPLNYVGMAVDGMLTVLFKVLFKFYGKSNRIFTKKIAAVARK
jgi:2-polyprenyl-3-methyl-5-hydroxy-6-metoxy-1,4-benzoquinol methylase